VFPEYKAERPVEYIGPVVALVGAQVGFGVVASGREDELVRLDSPGPAGQRQDDRAVAAGDGAQVDAGVAGRRRIDELVDCDPVGAGKREQLLERGTPQPRLEPGQGACGDACLRREVGERDPAVQPKAFQSRSDGVKGTVNGFIHPSILPFGNNVCPSALSVSTMKNEPRNATAEGRRPMTHGFDKDFWERHWQQGRAGSPGSMGGNPPNPYLARETGGLAPGTALDAGCGGGAEAIWLASQGWHVTAADISSEALARAAGRAAASGLPERLQWVEADLTAWRPGAQFDLVMTHYAHPAMPQLEFYDRIAGWVAPGGTLLIVGHLHTPGSADHGRHPPAEASVTSAAITARLDGKEWEIVTAEEYLRTLTGHEGRAVPLRDVVVRAARRGPPLG
jgi:SAM-dependent methyltransferase